MLLSVHLYFERVESFLGKDTALFSSNDSSLLLFAHDRWIDDDDTCLSQVGVSSFCIREQYPTSLVTSFIASVLSAHAIFDQSIVLKVF